MGGYTGQNILVFQATGAQIRRFLDQWARLPQGLAVGVSGLSATLDPHKPSGERVIAATVGDAPLDDAKTYKVSGVMYVVRRYPSLWESAPERIDGKIEWSRPVILAQMRKQGRFAPDLKPRLVLLP
jgi:hypothetical protein